MILTLRRLVDLGGVRARRVALSAALSALAVGFGVALITTAGYLISRAAEQPPILSLTMTIVAVRFFALARPLARYLDRLVSHDDALRALGRIRARFHERIEPLAPAQLEGYRRGELLGRMVGDVDSLQGLYLRGLVPPLVALAVGAVSVGVAAAVLPAAGVILAVGLVLVGLIVPVLAGALNRATGRRQAPARAELTAELVELLRGAPELVVYGREEETLARIRSRSRELARLGRRDALAAGLAGALSILIAGLTVAGVLAVAVSAHATGSFDRVLVATLALLALASFESVAPLQEAARELSSTLAAGRRVLELMDREPAVQDPVEPLPPPPPPATVALEQVTARYAPGEPPALKGFDLRLEPGRRIALVGSSGAGKTTVTNLLLRFLDPEEGRVTLAGLDVRDLAQRDVRGTFALAGQNAYLFGSTIRANLSLARPSATDDELWDVLRRARLADWVSSLPDGLETLVGEEGTQLSGGQRQRLTLARALLSDAPVLLLDEPTAHLDPETADALVRDVFAAADGRSVLLITHRPEGLELADEVVTLDGGSGKRCSDLLKRGPQDDHRVARPHVGRVSVGRDPQASARGDGEER
jgi:ATP-binding cassette, subfamily C, bacterial CydC